MVINRSIIPLSLQTPFPTLPFAKTNSVGSVFKMEFTLPPLISVLLFFLFINFSSNVLNKKTTVEHKKSHLVRECSCVEYDTCGNQIDTEVRGCFDSCWHRIGTERVTNKPEALKDCFRQKADIVKQFINCIKITGETCVNSKVGPQVKHVDINRIIGYGGRRIKTQAQAFKQTTGAKNQILIQSAIDLGTCMKDCFTRKDAAAQCFNKMGCEPKLDEDLVGPVIKRCARQIGWKRKAAELCECAQRQAGIQSLKPYCRILRGSRDAGHF